MKLKKMALKAFGALMSVALVAGMLTSCSKSGSSDALVENIPSTAMFVMKLNPQQVIENAGCSVDNGKIVLSQKYSDVIRSTAGVAALKVVEGYLSYTEGINLDAIMVFSNTENSRDAAMVASLSDPEAVKSHFKEICGNQKEEDGFEVYRLDRNAVVAINGNMLWFSENLNTIKKHIEEARKENLSKVKGIAEFLAEDNAFAFTYNLPRMNTMLKAKGDDAEAELVREGVPAGLAKRLANVMDYYVCGSLKLSGNVFSGEMFLADADGKRNEFGKALNVIDTDFLKNVPADANGVMAFGDIADADLKAVIDKAVAEYKAKPYNAETGVYFDFLTEWDGTAAIALECNELAAVDPLSLMNMSEMQMAQFFLKNIKFSAMAHYPGAVIANLSNLLYTTAQQNGVNPTAMADGKFSIYVPDAFTLYFGGENGYLTMSNYKVAGNATSLADKFNGKRFVIYSQQGANPMLEKFGWNFGSESELWLEADALKFRAELTGTTANFLQAIIEPLTDLDNLSAIADYFRQLEKMTDSYYGYSDYDYYDFEPEPDSDEYFDEL